jgi:energy-coupling factor transporter ATP-binding protein EcfA2
MYTSFSIENFRLFDKVTVEPLGRVNLIAGQNNAGKTALLEAIWLLNHPASPRQALRIASWRESTDYARGAFFADLFLGYDTDLTISIQAADSLVQGTNKLDVGRQYRTQQPLFDLSDTFDSDQGEEVVAEFDFENELIFDYIHSDGSTTHTSAWLDSSSKFGDRRPVLRDNGSSLAGHGNRCVFEHSKTRWNTRTLAVSFGRAEIEGTLPAIEQVIRLLEPRLKRMTTIADARGIPSIYGDIGYGKLFPMSIMGDGTKRILTLCLSFLRAQNGIILVDEIESGLHHSTLVDVWKNLNWLSREFNVQIFATTHSYECIVAAHNAFTEFGSHDLHLHHLYRRSACEPVRAMTYTKESLDTNIEYLWELR